MGAVANGVQELGNSVVKAGAGGVGKGAQCPLNMVKRVDLMDKLGNNTAGSLEFTT